MKYICDICNKQFESFAALGGHKSAHSIKAKESYKKRCEIASLRKIKVIKHCLKCGCGFTVIRTNKNGYQRIPKKEKRFCSRSCANSRHHSELTKEKISISLVGNTPWNKGNKITRKKRYCSNCNKEIKYNNKSGYCLKCSKNTARFKKHISSMVKMQYKNGKIVKGGTTKWIPYKNIKVQGSYEYRTCIILDKMIELNEILYWEYTRDRIIYLDEDNIEHFYLLDFKVIDNRKSIFYIETKGYIRKRDSYKWNAAKEQNIEVKKWFLKEIENQEKRLRINQGSL